MAVEGNKTAFALGRLGLAAPESLARLSGPQPQKVQLPLEQDKLDGPEGLIARRVRYLTAYQNTTYAQRYADLVQKVRAAESQLGEVGKAERLSKAAARYYAKLLAIKDEWEVARLYTDGTFEASMKAQFDKWESLSFHMAPPFLAKPGKDGRVKKITLGSWTFPDPQVHG